MSPVAIALGREHHRLQPGAAHLVDGQRGDVIGRGRRCSAACRAGFWPRPADTTLPMMHSSTMRGIDAGAAHRFGDDQRAELRRGEALQRAEELAGRRANGADDDRFSASASSARRSVDAVGFRRWRPAPSSVWSRVRITGEERMTGCAHCGALRLDQQDAVLEPHGGDAADARRRPRPATRNRPCRPTAARRAGVRASAPRQDLTNRLHRHAPAILSFSMRLDPCVRVAAPRRTAARGRLQLRGRRHRCRRAVRAGRAAARRTCGAWRRRSRACGAHESAELGDCADGQQSATVGHRRRRHRVVVDGEILGKPRTTPTPRGCCGGCPGGRTQVMTGVSLRPGANEVGARRDDAGRSSHADRRRTIAWYVASGEGRDKAGGYAIQGLASRFIPRIEGSYSNVVGLPVACESTELHRGVSAELTSASDPCIVQSVGLF